MNVNEDMFQSTTFKSIQCITLHFKYIVSEKNHFKTLSFVALFYLFSEKKLSEIKVCNNNSITFNCNYYAYHGRHLFGI